jgi:MFS transporter, DHA1 family, multidrug resistance protein
MSLSSRLFPVDQWQRNQLAVTISASLIFAGFTLVMPFLPLYIHLLGVQSQAQVAMWAGLVLGISPLIASLVGPFWGKVADRYGLKLMAVRISLALFLIWFFTGFARNVYHLLTLRILLGAFAGFNTFSISLVTQLCPEEKVSRVIGTLQATQILSAAVGPFLGGMLAGWIGIRNVFFVTSFMCLLSLLLFVFLYRDKPSRQEEFVNTLQSERQSHSFKTLMLLPNFTVLSVVLFGLTAIDRTFSPVIPLFVAGLTVNAMGAARTAGIIISLAAFGESLAAWYSGREVSKVSPKRILLNRLASGGIVCLGLTFANSIHQLLWLRVLLALLAGGTLTVAYTLASQVIPENHRAAAFGLLASFALLGGAAGPFVAGTLASFSLRTVFIADGLSYGLLFGLVLKYVLDVQIPTATQLPRAGQPSATEQM